MMSKCVPTLELKPTTKIRHLSFEQKSNLCLILTINSGWRELAAVVRDPDSKDYLYTSDDVCELETFPRPPLALLDDWGTRGRIQPNLADLITTLHEAGLLRAIHHVETCLLQQYYKDNPKSVNSDSDGSSEVESENVTLVLDLPAPENVTLFTFEELSHATDDFSPSLIVGEGSFGTVFVATVRGKKVAVKRLKEAPDRQFFTELNILSRCHHENLVPLVGWSVNGSHCCLLYEYMENGSLQDRLACDNGTDPLPAKSRLSIALGTANGINHLHTFGEVPLVHRDIKSANILLDGRMVARIGDFGVVRSDGSGIGSTVGVTQRVCGTPVYMAREAAHGDVSVKLDTFSYGVVLLELLTGLPPYDPDREERDLVSHVEEFDEEDLESLIDSSAEWSITNAQELRRIAFLCLTSAKKRRPTIAQVLDELENCCIEQNPLR